MSEATVGDTTSIPTRILVFGLVHRDGTLDASEVYPVATACGQSPEQVRSTIRRLVGEGLFERLGGEGRDARYLATDGGLAAIGSAIERHRLAYAQDAAGRGWDGRWHLVAFAVPEAARAARDTFRDRLLALGGALIHGGLYVSAHPWEKEVRDEAERLGIAPRVTLAATDDLDVGGTTDPRELARSLWDIDEVALGYRSFIERYEDVPQALEAMRQRHERLSDADFLPGALATVVDFQRCFTTDPLLPPELLPRPWPGRAARELLAKCRRLGVLAWERHDRPALFQPLDEVIETLR